MAAYRFVVSGRVQGVGYRYFALKEAQALGLAGYARNLDDGRVEVVAEGADSALASLEGRLKEGPSFARVEAVEKAATADRGDQGFHIR